MSTTEEPPVTSPSAGVITEPAVPPPKKLVATHPFRVYGYKLSHGWIIQFGKDKGLQRAGMSNNSLESAVFMYLLARLPGLQRHYLDDPDESFYGWSHCLAIANNWNLKKKSLVAGRLPKWKAVLGTDVEPLWHIPTRDTIPPIPREYRR
ncbi:hypothetical protein L210DRAFT_945047 [Boletus edulis BED1]|uniref:Uncharacterized protein n=1 Tax=Boletus edulis BED1 TaxID=1328754 RepID=A0AAD4BZ25_BOLED|nr:hypothetical protein L210DRAFT_945047 [Boletus edulis BED1]